MKPVTIVLLLIALVMNTGCNRSSLTEAKVSLKDGVVQGTIEDGMAVFRGIPFAAPPTGDLRWKAPQPVIPWEGVLEAVRFAPSPVQARAEWMGDIEMSEDCLYLNVWTPAGSKDEKLPVMFWIYGGGFSNGTTAGTIGKNLASNGVILVSVAYRLGALGFMAHPELSAESANGVSGNYGILDQIAGLTWVQQNIEAFGGDPSRVTIFGESAGAISVSMLCASPLAEGLFSGAISQSGGSFSPVSESRGMGEYMASLKGAEQQGLTFAERMGAQSIKEMRTIPYDRWLDDPLSQMGGFWPNADGYVIAGDQYKLYLDGSYNDVNVIIGTNSDEGSMFVQPMEPEQYAGMIKGRFGPLADRALELYPGNDQTEVYHSMADIFEAATFAWPSWAWARLQSETGSSRVYMYYFDQFRPEPFFPGGPVPRGAAHAMEIPYVFGTAGQNPGMEATDEEKVLSDIMIRYWTNFAKTGDPNSEGLPEWPVYKDGEKTVMHLKGSEPVTTELPDAERMQFMEEYFKWLREK